MVFDKNYYAAREDAIKWLNRDARKRNYLDGVEILDRMQFKPLLAKRLRMYQPNDILMKTLAQALTDGANVCRNPNNPKYVDGVPAELEVAVSGAHQDVASEAAVAAEGEKVDDVRVMSAAAGNYPDMVQRVYRWFSKDYKLRDKLHREMVAIGESNDDLSMSRRKELSEKINLLSEEMDALYQLRERYHVNGIIPTQEELDSVKFVSVEKNASTVKVDVESSSLKIKTEDFSSMGREELNKRIHSLQTSITRKKNNLLYQSPSKKDKENPMPISPKRTKIETQIQLLDEKLFQARTALAKMG